MNPMVCVNSQVQATMVNKTSQGIRELSSDELIDFWDSRFGSQESMPVEDVQSALVEKYGLNSRPISFLPGREKPAALLFLPSLSQ